MKKAAEWWIGAGTDAGKRRTFRQPHAFALGLLETGAVRHVGR